MTAPAPAHSPVADGEQTSTVRFVELSLQHAAARLSRDASPADVMAAERVLDEAERSLGLLTTDPWEPSLGPLRQAREILSSHLLAAAACADAHVAAPITGRVLRRGAHSAWRVLSTRYEHTPADSSEVGDRGDLRPV